MPDTIDFENEIADIQKSASSTSQQSPLPQSQQNQQTEEKRKRGRPKGSKNKLIVDNTNPTVQPQSSSNTGIAPEKAMFKMTPALATGFISLFNGFFIVMKLEPISETEKAGFLEVWSGVELPFDPESKFAKFLPLISASLFTLALLAPRLMAMKNARKQQKEEKKQAEQEEKDISEGKKPVPIEKEIEQVTPPDTIQPQEVKDIDSATPINTEVQEFTEKTSHE